MKDDPEASAPRRGGRPRSAEPSGRVSTWLPNREHDRLIRLAAARDQSVSRVIRELLIKSTR